MFQSASLIDPNSSFSMPRKGLHWRKLLVNVSLNMGLLALCYSIIIFVFNTHLHVQWEAVKSALLITVQWPQEHHWLDLDDSFYAGGKYWLPLTIWHTHTQSRKTQTQARGLTRHVSSWLCTPQFHRRLQSGVWVLCVCCWREDVPHTPLASPPAHKGNEREEISLTLCFCCSFFPTSLSPWLLSTSPHDCN